MTNNNILFSLSLLLLLSCGNKIKSDVNDQVDNVNADTVAADTFSVSASSDSIIAVDSATTADEKKVETVKDTCPLSITRAKEITKNGSLLIPSVKVKGLYITGPIAGSKRMNSIVDLITSTELNTIVLDIKNDGGELTYRINNPTAIESGACYRYVRDMPAFLDRMHKNGIYVIGRIVCFKDPILAKHKPDLALCKPDGAYVTDGKGLPWVNPYKKEVWNYLCELAEQATEDGFDEIQFDYVRFPIGKDANAACYGANLKEYTREQLLTDFFSYVQNRLHEKNIVWGADLFGTVIGSNPDRYMTGQNYPALAKVTDAICPMIYPSHYRNNTFGLAVPDAEPYKTILKACQLSQKILNDTLHTPKARVRPWLQCFTAKWVKGHISYGSQQLKEQIQAVYDSGYDEWILWNAANRYDYVKNAVSKN